METLMRVIEANQDNMKEGEYLEAMNALRDLHRNQEHDYEAIMRPLREAVQKDMQNLWKWVCVAPCNDEGDRWFTSAKETMESWLWDDTIENLVEWRDEYIFHRSENFELCEACGLCTCCGRCECNEPEEEPEEESEGRVVRNGVVVSEGYEQCEKCERQFALLFRECLHHEFYTHDGDGNVVRKEGKTCSNCRRECVGCGSKDVVYWECGGELGCNMCEKCFT